MTYWSDDEDEEAIAWQKKRRNVLKEGEWNQVPIELETRRGRVILNWKEWRQLQRFLREYDLADTNEIKPDHYEHLPHKVKVVIEDWLRHRAGVPFKY
jgi:hypothetical protein